MGEQGKWREAEYTIPDDILSQIVLKLIYIMGQKLILKWTGGYGKPQTVDWMIVPNSWKEE